MATSLKRGPIVLCNCVKFCEIRFINMAVSGEVPVARVVVYSYHGNQLKTWAPLPCAILSSLVKFGS